MPVRLNALVLESDWPARCDLVRLIEQSGLAHVIAAVPTAASATEVLAASPEAVDVAFVDVRLTDSAEPTVAGLRWIEQTLAAGAKASVAGARFVLAAASEAHAIRAYELGVVDYLLKPFDAARVRVAIRRVSAALERARSRRPEHAVRVAARDGRTIVFLRRDEILAFEADGRLCFVHSSRGRLDIDVSLAALESQLGTGFVRVHRRWLVSLDHVLSMERGGGQAMLLLGAGGPPLRVNVARDRAAVVLERLLSRAVGLRHDGHTGRSQLPHDECSRVGLDPGRWTL